MIEIKTTQIFEKWFATLKDIRAKAMIDMRLARLQRGNFGDAKAVGNGVHELRIHYGAGYRVYFINEGMQIVVLLCGGDKATQDTDIKRAKRIAKELLV
jgi:putative addiction module killer protein